MRLDRSYRRSIIDHRRVRKPWGKCRVTKGRTPRFALFRRPSANRNPRRSCTLGVFSSGFADTGSRTSVVPFAAATGVRLQVHLFNPFSSSGPY